MTKRKTVGEQSLLASGDNSTYDPLELGYALCDDVVEQMMIAAQRHERIFGEEEYFVILQIAEDPLIKGIMRKKYYAYLHLPSPRPEQTVFLYNKVTQKLKRLWSLPNFHIMEQLYLAPTVSEKWKKTKGWVKSFYDGYFWENIRKENNFNHLSESEYLFANRQKFIEAGAKECTSDFSDPFDFTKIKIDHIVDTKTARQD